MLTLEERNALAASHIGLAVFFYRRYASMLSQTRHPNRVEADELFSTAMWALVMASRTYDPARGKFKGHAKWVLKGYLRRIFLRKRLRIDGGYHIGRNAEARPSYNPEPRRELARLMECLTPRERAAVKAVFLLNPNQAPGKTLALRWGISPQRVSQIAYRAKQKMQERWQSLNTFASPDDPKSAHRRTFPA